MIELICKDGDYSYWDDDPKIYLTKTDRNGTRYYTDVRCPKCGGTGFIDYYAHVSGGVCFMCGGTGEGSQKMKVYTPEYFQVLTNKRREKLIKAAAADNARWLKKEGFTPEGKTYIVLGKTFVIKDELKAAGAYFNYLLGWHFNKPVDSYPVKEITAADVVDTDEDGNLITLLEVNGVGHYDYPYSAVSVQNYIKGIQDEYLKATAPKTEWYGTIKERVTLSDCTAEVLAMWEGMYGTTIMYKFVSPDGYQFIWKTSTFAVDAEDINSGKKFTITGTIKDHTEYKGQKQTELTRCKIFSKN